MFALRGSPRWRRPPAAAMSHALVGVAVVDVFFAAAPPGAPAAAMSRVLIGIGELPSPQFLTSSKLWIVRLSSCIYADWQRY